MQGAPDRDEPDHRLDGEAEGVAERQHQRDGRDPGRQVLLRHEVPRQDEVQPQPDLEDAHGAVHEHRQRADDRHHEEEQQPGAHQRGEEHEEADRIRHCQMTGRHQHQQHQQRRDHDGADRHRGQVLGRVGEQRMQRTE